MDINSAKNDSSGVCKKYTREELFGLAMSMSDKLLVEDLKKFENYEWTSICDNEFRGDGCTMSKPVKSLSNFGRRNSELTRDYTSMNADSRFFSESQTQIPTTSSALRGNKFRPISRMASNPSIGFSYRNNHQITAEARANNGVTMQVRAKYARLIESMEKSVSKHNLMNLERSQRDNVSTSRSSLHRTLSNERGRQSAERPTQLFGPLRKESPTISHLNARGQVDYEQLSLPYMGSNTSDSYSLTSRSSSRVADDPMSSVRKRSLTKDQVDVSNTEEDDFDINSLLSITVLSDIKAYRNDLQVSGSRQQSMDLGGSTHKTQVTTKSPRMVTRSRTATDFTYNGRRGYDAMQQHSSHGYTATMHSGPTGRLDISYNNAQVRRQLMHQPNSFHAQEMAFESRVNSNQPENNSNKKIDENVLQIIETFKAQVKARAEAKELNRSVTSDCTSSKVDYQEKNRDPKLESPHGKLDPSKSATESDSREIPSSGSNDRDKTELEKQAPKHADAGGKPVQVEGVPGDDVSRDVSQVIESSLTHNDPNKENALSQISSESHHDEERVIVASGKKLVGHLVSKPSSIPRLINLPQILSATKDITSTQTIVLTTTNHSRENPFTKTSPISTKQPDKPVGGTKVVKGIVSRYKLLRGKSLADEVDEVPK